VAQQLLRLLIFSMVIFTTHVAIAVDNPDIKQPDTLEEQTKPSTPSVTDVIMDPTSALSEVAIATREKHWLTELLLYILGAVIILILIYTVRHYWFTFNRLFSSQRHPYLDIDTANWPEVTVLIPAHNEEQVISNILEALLTVDYPEEKLIIIPINDRSIDNTATIIDEYAKKSPLIIKPFHRLKGKAGKAAALKDATELVTTEILLVFDADYIPGKGLIKQLVTPFFDPEVGAMMGRVVPHNVGRNLLTRLMDLERAGGYQVDQQARMNMHLVPQYGGTVGGVRLSALKSVGGWDENTLAEDTDVTYRLLLSGWKTVYQNRSECYEEAPETWEARKGQIMRWAKGHNHATARYTIPLLRYTNVGLFEKIDGLLLLCIYAMSPVLLMGWLAAIYLFFAGEHLLSGVLGLLAITSFGALGNFAAYFEIAAAAKLDGSHQRIRLLPLNIINFLFSLLAITRATLSLIALRGIVGEVIWYRTQRFRR